VGNAVVVGDSVGDNVGGNVHSPHDSIQMNLALPRLLPLLS